MSLPNDRRPTLSPEISDRLSRALLLSRDLQTPSSDADGKLVELRSLLDRCREGIRSQKPDHGRYRLLAVNQARNFLHFLPSMHHPEASGRLRSVSRRLQRALRTA